MHNEDILELIRKLIHDNVDSNVFRTYLEEYHPYDIAMAFTSLNDQERQAVYELLDEETLADIFASLNEEEAALYIKEMSYNQGAEVLNEMETDDAVDILNEISDEESSGYLDQMDLEDAKELTSLSEYEEDTAGSIMSTNYIKIPIGVDVKEAMRILGYSANDTEVIDPLFVCDENDELKGVLTLQDLIIARTPKCVDDIMNKNFVFGTVEEETISIANKITNYDIYALPILKNKKMVGIVTMDDAIDVAKSEIQEDYTKLANVEEVTTDSNFWKNILQRIPWLVVLLIVSLLISNVTKEFEEIISKITVLWFFNTMILDMAGNAGTQTLAVTVRKLGRKDLTTAKRSFLYIIREFLVVFINSLVLEILSFGVCILFIWILKFGDRVNIIPTALVISSSLSITLIITGILGAIIPIILDKIHLDPAVASGPLITTINDVLALIVYFGLATIFMEYIIK